jgi:hypothetical protein
VLTPNVLNLLHVTPQDYALSSCFVSTVLQAIFVYNIWTYSWLFTNYITWFQTFTVFWMLYAFFWVIPRRLNFICRHFGTLCLFHLHRQVGVPMKMEQTVCSETLAYKIQMPGNYPEESIQITFHLPNSSEAWVITIKLKAKEKFLMVVMLLFYILQKYDRYRKFFHYLVITNCKKWKNADSD